MKILIITVAGCATRFSESIGKETLKCIYYKNDFRESLLYRMIHQPVQFDKYIIVGGYKYDELKKTIDTHFVDYKDRIVLIENPYYKEYGSGFSLYYGIREALKYSFREIVFAEGDLFVDSDSFVRIFKSKRNVITYNNNPITAKKAVAFYLDVDDKGHYIYDAGHSALSIGEPFTAIYNSGQIWKFADADILRKIYDEMIIDDWKGTNLVPIEKYFGELKSTDYELIGFDKWINCNTIDDFNGIGD